jgi:ADP-ribosyl-[dinitrogen reductase] hydrolase
VTPKRPTIPSMEERIDPAIVSRAQGCLLGQLAGDALGSMVEFQSPEDIRRVYPNGIRELADGGTWNTIAGQPTDDSEMALMLARMLAEQGQYDAEEARKAYRFWLDSHPFGCGNTIYCGLHGRPNLDSQANGAMMRISPLGIFGANYDLQQVSAWAQQDAALTHPHPVCLQASTLFAMAIAHAISTGIGSQDLFRQIETWAREMKVEDALLKSITDASTAPPSEYIQQQGWVLTAFQNAVWQLLHASNLEDGVTDTVMRGGDTDTNAAIAGALLGAVHGRDTVPTQWVETLLNCRPEAGQPHIRHPRPKCFWPVDALELAERLIQRLETDVQSSNQ